MNKVNCDCVILCGGLGKRLRSALDGDVPKVMAAVDDRPFLDFILEYLQSQNVERVVLCTGYKADFVEDYYRDHTFDLIIDFSREEKPLGTGGALKNAREIIFSDSLLVFNGDSLVFFDLLAFLDFHRKNEALASMLISKVQDGGDCGNLEINQDNEIISFQEKIQKAAESWVNAGVYCFNKEIFTHMPAEENFSLEHDFFPQLIGHQFYGYCVEEEFMDIGTPERYKLIQQKLKKG
mgnify:CR=1 FL=1